MAIFLEQFANPPLEKKGTVTLRVNRSDGAKESCKVKTKKMFLQFTTSREICKLKSVLGCSITVSSRMGFPTAPKRLQAGDNYLFTKQTAGMSEYVNAILPPLPDDELDLHPTSNGYYFLWCQDTEKVRITTRWERLKISNDRVSEELRRSTQGYSSSDDTSSHEATATIEIGDDFPYHQAQFEVQNFIGDTYVRCIVIESA